MMAFGAFPLVLATDLVPRGQHAIASPERPFDDYFDTKVAVMREPVGRLRPPISTRLRGTVRVVRIAEVRSARGEFAQRYRTTRRWTASVADRSSEVPPRPVIRAWALAARRIDGVETPPISPTATA